MGCSASSVQVLPPDEPDDGSPLGTSAIAKKLSEMLGAPEKALREALPGLNRCFARRLPGRKRIYKPLDLWALTAFVETADGGVLGGAGPHALPPDVTKELAKLTPSSRDSILKLLRTSHYCGGWLPKICIGNASIYTHLPSDEHAPVAHAYDEGNRIIVLPDPVSSVPPMDWAPGAFHDGEAIGRELAGKDLSRAVVFGMAPPPESIGKAPWSDAEKQAPAAKIKASAELFRQRIGHAAGTFDAAGKALGQPCHDVYCLMSCCSMGPKMAPQCDIPVDVHWRALEDLVYAGDVRSIGVSNMTKLQLQGLLGVCRIRPAVLWTEAHPWADSAALTDLIEFCLAEGIAVMAHTPLAQGSRLDDPRLAGLAGLTPAQAALRWSLDRGMTCNVGVKDKWMIRENLRTPTREDGGVALPALAAEADAAAEPLYLQIANVPGWRRFFAPEAAAASGAAPTGTSTPTPSRWRRGARSSGSTRCRGSTRPSSRACCHLRSLSSADGVARAIASRPSPRGRSGGRRGAAAAAAAAAATAATAVLAQMQVVPLAAFAAHGAIRDAHAERAAAGAGAAPPLHVPATSSRRARASSSSRSGGCPSPPRRRGADQARRRRPRRARTRRRRASARNVYAFDFASVEQDDFAEMVACINALGLYIAASDAFVAFEHPEYWGRAWCLVEQAFGDAVRVPRYMIASATGALETTCDGKALRNRMVDPVEGALTVEADRPVIEMEGAIALALRSQLFYGANSQAMSALLVEQEIEKSLAEGGDGGDGDITGMHGNAAAAAP